MKKHYLLTIAAGMLFSLAVSAQTGHVKRHGMLHKDAQKTKSFMNQPVVTRAASTALPDSVVYLDDNGEKVEKTIFSYNEAGLVENQKIYDWDDPEGWILYEETSFTYDGQGRVVSSKMRNDDGQTLDMTYSYEGNVCTYQGKYASDSEPICIYQFNWKGTRTYDNSGKLLSETNYRLVDLNGDGKIDNMDKPENIPANTKSGDDELPWMKLDETTYEYDEKGEYAKIVEAGFWWFKLSYTKTTTFYDRNDNGSYKKDVVTEYVGEEPNKNTYKYEASEGTSSKIDCYRLDDETGEWVLEETELTHYPEGGSVANDAIETAPEVKITVANGVISFDTPRSMLVQVYSILGSCRYNATVNGNASVSGLPTGIYVVRANGKAVKVCVR